MTDHAIRARGGARLVARLGALGILLALIALITLALAPLGWRAGWWHYSVSFQYMLTYGAYAGAAAAAVGLIAVIACGVVGHRRGIVLGAVALIIGGGVAYVPWTFDQARYALPRIND